MKGNFGIKQDARGVTVNDITYIHPNGYLSQEAVDALWDRFAPESPKPMVISHQLRGTEATVGPLNNKISMDAANSLEEHLKANIDNTSPQIFLVHIHQGHWTALSVHNTADRKAQVIYLDSVGKGGEKPPVFVTSALNKVYGRNQQIFPVTHPYQQKGAMCGLHSCLNAIALTDATTAQGDPILRLGQLLTSNGKIDKTHQTASQYIQNNGAAIFSTHARKEAGVAFDPTIMQTSAAFGAARTGIKEAFLKDLSILNRHTGEDFVSSPQLDEMITLTHQGLKHANILDKTSIKGEFEQAIKSFMLEGGVEGEEDQVRKLGKIFAIRSLNPDEHVDELYLQVSTAVLAAIDEAVRASIPSPPPSFLEEDPFPDDMSDVTWEEISRPNTPSITPPPDLFLEEDLPSGSGEELIIATKTIIPSSTPLPIDFSEEIEFPLGNLPIPPVVTTENKRKKPTPSFVAPNDEVTFFPPPAPEEALVVPFKALIDTLPLPAAQSLDRTIAMGIEKLHTSPEKAVTTLYATLLEENKHIKPAVYSGLGVETTFIEEGGVKGFRINAVKEGSPLEANKDDFENKLITAYGIKGADGTITWKKISSENEDVIAFRQAALENGALFLEIYDPQSKHSVHTHDIKCSLFKGRDGEGKFSFVDHVQERLHKEVTQAGRNFSGISMQTGTGSEERPSFVAKEISRDASSTASTLVR